MHDLAAYLGNLLVAIVCHLAAWAIGSRIYPYVVGDKTAHEGRAEAAFFSTILGFVVLGYAAFALGILGGLYAPLLAASVVLPAAYAVSRLVVNRAWKAWTPTISDVAFVVAAAAIFAAIPLSLSPILEHDDNVYHLFIPQTYLQHHRIVHLPLIFANMPHLVELLYMFPLSLGDFTAAKCLNLFFNLWMIVGLRSLARGEMGRSLAGVAGLLYLSNPSVQWHLGRAYIEPVMGVFLLGGAIAFLRYLERREPAYLWLTGIGCGAAAGSKYQGWVFGLTILVFVGIAIGNRATTWSARGALALRPLCGFAILAIPWIVKNLAMTGNPIYPMAYRVLGGKDLSDIQVFHLIRAFTHFGGPKTLPNLLMLPVRLVAPLNTDFVPTFSATMMILVVVALILPRSYRLPHGYVVGMAFVGFAGWAFSCQMGRYLVAWLPVMTLAALVPLGLLPTRRGVAEGVALVVVVVAGFQQYRLPVETTLGVPATAVFSQPRERLLAMNLNFELCDYLDRDVPRHGKVLGMWENRFYFLKREVICDSIYEAPFALAWLRRLDDPGRFVDELRSQGVTHVVVNTYVADLYFGDKLGFSLLDDRHYPASMLDHDRALFRRFVSEELSLVGSDGTDVVFRLNDKATQK